MAGPCAARCTASSGSDAVAVTVNGWPAANTVPCVGEVITSVRGDESVTPPRASVARAVMANVPDAGPVSVTVGALFTSTGSAVVLLNAWLTLLQA